MADQMRPIDPQTALVAQGASIVRLENNTQMQIAMQMPRDEQAILDASLKELVIYPSMAEEALYIKPVGKNADTNAMTYAEGLSIRTAESLANRWKNSSYGCEVVGEDENVVSLAAVFLDYENNTRHVVMARVAKSFKKRSGDIVKRGPDQLELAVKAEQSKALREVILRSLPAGLKKEYENKVRLLLKGGKIENRRQSILARFADLGVDQATLEKHIGKPVEKWVHENIVVLLGIANAIRDGEMTKSGAFGGEESEEKKTTLSDSVQPGTGQGKKTQTNGKPQDGGYPPADCQKAAVLNDEKCGHFRPDESCDEQGPCLFKVVR